MDYSSYTIIRQNQNIYLLLTLYSAIIIYLIQNMSHLVIIPKQCYLASQLAIWNFLTSSRRRGRLNKSRQRQVLKKELREIFTYYITILLLSNSRKHSIRDATSCRIFCHHRNFTANTNCEIHRIPAIVRKKSLILNASE